LKGGGSELVRDAPAFSDPAHAVYAEGGDAELIRMVLAGLREVARSDHGLGGLAAGPAAAGGPRLSQIL
jgi:hypothetical protein